MYKLGSLKAKHGRNMLLGVYINFGMKQTPFPLFPPRSPLSLYAADLHPATNDRHFTHSPCLSLQSTTQKAGFPQVGSRSIKGMT